jgi:hypothetical protein
VTDQYVASKFPTAEGQARAVAPTILAIAWVLLVPIPVATTVATMAIAALSNSLPAGVA